MSLLLVSVGSFCVGVVVGYIFGESEAMNHMRSILEEAEDG